jgi:hypothetical protein
LPYPELQKDTYFVSRQDHEMHYASLVSGITNGNMKNKLGYMKKYTPIAISCLTGPGIDDPKATCLRIINYIKKNISKT